MSKDEREQIYKGMSEHEHQRELFSWAAAVKNYGFKAARLWVANHPQTLKRADAKLFQTKPDEKGDDRLRWLHAIPNGGVRGGNAKQRMINGAKMKAEGVKNGIPDVFLPYTTSAASGLYIEMKKLKGRMSKEQVEFERYAMGSGYHFACCRGYLEAIDAIESYLGVAKECFIY